MRFETRKEVTGRADFFDKVFIITFSKKNAHNNYKNQHCEPLKIFL